MSLFIVSGLYAGGPDFSDPNFRSDTDGSALRPQSDNKKRILVVDDETLIADTLTEILNDSGFEAITAYTAESALQLARGFRPHILMSDVLMPQINGVELAIAMQAAYPATKILLFSGQPSTGAIVQNARNQGYDFEVLGKPVLPEDLIVKLRAM
jgi:DNA-binding NtrC family response regulator